MSTVFIGLMSGTSLDGIDGVLVDFAAKTADPGPVTSLTAATRPCGQPTLLPLLVLAHAHSGFAPGLRSELLALNRPSGDEIHRAALAANALARACAGVVETLLGRAALDRAAVAAIGCHGQTVRHRPGEFDGIGYSVQLNAPALLAELSGIDVVADFRSRDVAAHGQGAPLVPAFHRVAFASPGRAAAVLNLGGIANLTSIAADSSTIGFDCGPGNVLLDLWCAAATGQPFDAAGAWGASGQVDRRLLEALLDEPYFAAPAPKSTGRDRFDRAWLDAALAASEARRRLPAKDIQATLAELTAQTCAEAFHNHAAEASELVVCGGGARNDDLTRRLADRIAPRPVITSDARGLPVDQVEAAAFAWLARAFVHREAGNIAAVTGAAGPRILGALYPAR